MASARDASTTAPTPLESPVLSVVICTHNPNRAVLKRALAALEVQTLPREQWELVLIDNASEAPLTAEELLSWHPNAVVHREPQLGILFARAAGVRVARSELVVFVDDDNILAADYLAVGLDLAARWPMLGAFGGAIVAEYEKPLPPGFQSVEFYFGVANHARDAWSNLPFSWDTIPPTAGMFIRRDLARRHFEHAMKDERRLRYVGRRGQGQLFNGEDTDLTESLIDQGLGTGRFMSLRLTHVIEARRCDPAYLLRLVEGTTFSSTLLEHLHGRQLKPRLRRQRLLDWLRVLASKPPERQILLARMRGRDRATSIALGL